MHKTFRLLFIIAILAASLPLIAFAQDVGDCSKSTGIWQAFGGGDLLPIFPHYCDYQSTSLFVLSLLTGLIGIVATAAIMFSGYRWMTSAGDTKRLETAKNGLKWSVLGLIIVLLANIIIYFVTNLIGDGVGNIPAGSEQPVQPPGGGGAQGGTNNPDEEDLTPDPNKEMEKIIVSSKETVNALSGVRYKKFSVSLAAEESSLKAVCGEDRSYPIQLLVDGVAESKGAMQKKSDVGFSGSLEYEAEILEETYYFPVDVWLCGRSVPNFPQEVNFGP